MNVNESDTIGRNVYLLACINGCLDVAKYLYETGEVDVNEADVSGCTGLSAVCSRGHLHILRYLCEEQNIGVNDRYHENITPLMYVCSGGHVEVMKYIFERYKVNMSDRDDDGRTAFMIACASDSRESMDCLTHIADLDLDATNTEGFKAVTPAHHAGNDAIVRKLIDTYGTRILTETERNSGFYGPMSGPDDSDDFDSSPYCSYTSSSSDDKSEDDYCCHDGDCSDDGTEGVFTSSSDEFFEESDTEDGDFVA